MSIMKRFFRFIQKNDKYCPLIFQKTLSDQELKELVEFNKKYINFERMEAIRLGVGFGPLPDNLVKRKWYHIFTDWM